MRTVDDCIFCLVPALMEHLVDEKLGDKGVHLLRSLSDKIHDVLGDNEGEDNGGEQEESFSLKSACHKLTRELQKHRGELTSSEKINLLELIEASAKIMQFY